MRLHKDSKFSGRLFFHKWHLEYGLWSSFCHAYYERDKQRTFAIALPPFALWVSVDNPRWCAGNRHIGLSISAWSFRWNLWTDDDIWDSRTPRWRQGSFAIDNFLFGKASYERKVIEERDIKIPMPEGCYDAHIKLCEDKWTRRRGLTKIVKRIDADIPKGIPCAGKGENSWDCGDDATFGMCCVARSIAEGVGHIVGGVLHDRVRYGGWEDWHWQRGKPLD